MGLGWKGVKVGVQSVGRFRRNRLRLIRSPIADFGEVRPHFKLFLGRCSVSNEFREDFLVRREATGLALAVDAVTVDLDIEDAASARDQRGVVSEFLLDRGRQTGGLWFVVSLHTEGDLDLHDGFQQKRVERISAGMR